MPPLTVSADAAVASPAAATAAADGAIASALSTGRRATTDGGGGDVAVRGGVGEGAGDRRVAVLVADAAEAHAEAEAEADMDVDAAEVYAEEHLPDGSMVAMPTVVGWRIPQPRWRPPPTPTPPLLDARL